MQNKSSNMSESDKFLVVVSILEGKNFPKRSNYSLLVEARFDGELLTTDPVDHLESPDFTQELAWELDKKSLHQHRLQRSSVKVQLYSVDKSSSVKEPIGYVVLDLRSAPSHSDPKWLPILQCKYRRGKPEIRLSLYIDDEKESEPANVKVKEVQPTSAKKNTSGKSAINGKQPLKPILNDEDGYYQIGALNESCEKFVLSVTIAFATNLIQLIPSNVPLPSSGYYFYYSLLGNDITNEVFHDLLNPSFPAERASVRLSTSLDSLRLFLSQQPGLQIHLCCGDQSLGSCEVTINNLLKKGSKEIYMKPVAVEGAFKLIAPKSAKLVVPAVESEDQRPTVGVSVVLRLESPPAASEIKSPEKQILSPRTKAKLMESNDKSEIRSNSNQSNSKPLQDKNNNPTKNFATGTMNADIVRDVEVTPTRNSPTAAVRTATETKQKVAVVSNSGGALDGSYTETLEPHDDENHDYEDDFENDEDSAGSRDKRMNQEIADVEHQRVMNREQEVLSNCEADNLLKMTAHSNFSQGEESESITQRYLAVPEQPHHYTVSIDVRSVKNLNIQHPTFIFLRYTYMFFGSTSPIITHPPVETRRGSEILLPQSFCAFDFATTFQQMQETFSRVPLVIEAWERSHEMGQNSCVGVASVPLSAVIRASKSNVTHSSGTSGTKQTWSDWININDNDSGVRNQIGVLQVIVTLEDWGLINQQTVVVTKSTSAELHKQHPQVHSDIPQSRDAVVSDNRAISSRETPEYKVALELEMWKQQQESLFTEQLGVKEKQLMKALAEEWKRNDKEREVLVKKRMAEYQELEEQLRTTLSDLERRERTLADNEKHVSGYRVDLQREHERKMSELTEASRRMKDDFDYQLALQKRKVEELEAALARLKQQLAESEAKNKQQAREFNTYREQLNNKPEIKLQSEINLIMLEKVELERRLDTVTKSKLHYKQQWTRALKELARSKQKEQVQARAQLKKQQQELEQMKLRYLAAEEKEAAKMERQELEQLKNELNSLKENEFSRSDQSRMMKQSDYNYVDDDDDDDGHITRLIEERDTLLRTGVYTSDDRIITELDRQIREAIAIRSGDNEDENYELMRGLKNKDILEF